MKEHNIIRLTDREIMPEDDLLLSLTGEKMVYWERINSHARENYKNVTGSWRYYNDGKEWLYKLASGKKTLCWAALRNGTFRITFWFADKAEPFIEAGQLPPSLKDEFRAAKKIGAIRPLSVTLNEHTDADSVITLLSIKHKLK